LFPNIPEEDMAKELDGAEVHCTDEPLSLAQFDEFLKTDRWDYLPEADRINLPSHGEKSTG
jgi:hypothetical protein